MFCMDTLSPMKRLDVPLMMLRSIPFSITRALYMVEGLVFWKFLFTKRLLSPSDFRISLQKLSRSLMFISLGFIKPKRLREKGILPELARKVSTKCFSRIFLQSWPWFLESGKE